MVGALGAAGALCRLVAGGGRVELVWSARSSLAFCWGSDNTTLLMAVMCSGPSSLSRWMAKVCVACCPAPSGSPSPSKERSKVK